MNKKKFQIFYKKSLYLRLKAIEQSFQKIFFYIRKILDPSFNTLQSFGVAHKSLRKKDFPSISLYKSGPLYRPLPNKFSKQYLHPRFINEENVIFPEATVSFIPNGVASSGAEHLSSQAGLIHELSEAFTESPPEKHRFFTFKKERLPIEIKKINGTVASLVARSDSNYYHFLFDVLPRYHLLEKSHIEIDYYYVSQKEDFQRDSLAKLGIPKKKIISSNDFSFIEADTLLVPYFLLHPFTPEQGNFPIPPWAYTYLQKTFVDKRSKIIKHRIFISRAKATRRRIINEQELTPILRDYGFKILALEDLAFLEKVELFSHAKCVVSPMGAGLANIVFAPNSCKVLEIFAPRATCVCYWSLSALGNLSYQFLYGEKGHKELESDVEEGFDHILVNVKTFKKALKKLISC